MHFIGNTSMSNGLSSEVGYKMRDLETFIKPLVSHEMSQHLESYMDSVQLDLVPKNMGQGMEILKQRYVAKFYFGKLLFKDFDPAVLYCNVAAWLMDNDQERNDTEGLIGPDVELTRYNEHEAEVLITIEFEEPIKVSEDPDGEVYWKNKRWAITPYDIYIADKFTLDISHSDEVY